jgi:hypothetical protein
LFPFLTCKPLFFLCNSLISRGLGPSCFLKKKKTVCCTVASAC